MQSLFPQISRSLSTAHDGRIMADNPNEVVEARLLLQDGEGGGLGGRSGRFRFRVNASFIRWHLEVRELTPAEAEGDTPRQPRQAAITRYKLP